MIIIINRRPHLQGGRAREKVPLRPYMASESDVRQYSRAPPPSAMASTLSGSRRALASSFSSGFRKQR